VENVRTALANSSLNAGQRHAVETIVSTYHRFVGIQGDAGTGKTYTVNQAVALIKRAASITGEGYRTVALAPYGNQVKALKNEGLEANTLASFLRTKDKPIDDKTIIVLDEAGVAGARQMEQVMRIVEKAAGVWASWAIPSRPKPSKPASPSRSYRKTACKSPVSAKSNGRKSRS
jgi:ABC-type dipeptide/oligopeptide/nickel transport system ATPase component